MGGEAGDAGLPPGKVALGRAATPEDIVGPAIFLASSDSDYVTGHTLFVVAASRRSQPGEADAREDAGPRV